MTNKGFTLIEIIVSLAVFSLIFITVMSFIYSINSSNLRTKTDRETLENARRAMDVMVHEIKSAKSIYTSTTTQNQLSLETTNYLPDNETTSYIDFFLCGQTLCLKKESQSPIVLTSDSVTVTNLVFSQIQNSISPSVKVNLTITDGDSSANLTSTASLRSY